MKCPDFYFISGQAQFVKAAENINISVFVDIDKTLGFVLRNKNIQSLLDTLKRLKAGLGGVYFKKETKVKQKSSTKNYAESAFM